MDIDGRQDKTIQVVINVKKCIITYNQGQFNFTNVNNNLIIKVRKPMSSITGDNPCW